MARLVGMVAGLQEAALARWIVAGQRRGRCMEWAGPSCSMYVAGWPLAMAFEDIWRILAAYGLIEMVEVCFELIPFRNESDMNVFSFELIRN
jgi:hypothetical protein